MQNLALNEIQESMMPLWSVWQIGKSHYKVTLADALVAHEDSLTRGGRPGVSNLNAVQGALGRPYHGYHRPIARKAAALLHGMVKCHGFVDANKRTAFLVTLVLLDGSDYSLRLKPDEDPKDTIIELLVDIAEGSMPEEELVRWFRKRIVRT